MKPQMPEEAQLIATRLAVRKVSDPEWGVTQQFLAVHQLAVQPAAVLPDEDGFVVYFAVQREPYFLCVAVCPVDGDWQVVAVYPEAKCHTVLLRFQGFREQRRNPFHLRQTVFIDTRSARQNSKSFVQFRIRCSWPSGARP